MSLSLDIRPQARRDVNQINRRLLLRSFPVSIFYRASDTTITIVRVLHQARDIPPLLENV